MLTGPKDADIGELKIHAAEGRAFLSVDHVLALGIREMPNVGNGAMLTLSTALIAAHASLMLNKHATHASGSFDGC